jgi:hypothetical protein
VLAAIGLAPSQAHCFPLNNVMGFSFTNKLTWKTS